MSRYKIIVLLCLVTTVTVMWCRMGSDRVTVSYGLERIRAEAITIFSIRKIISYFQFSLSTRLYSLC
jgi:hypothetical protein